MPGPRRRRAAAAATQAGRLSELSPSHRAGSRCQVTQHGNTGSLRPTRNPSAAADGATAVTVTVTFKLIFNPGPAASLGPTNQSSLSHPGRHAGSESLARAQINVFYIPNFSTTGTTFPLLVPDL